MSVFLILVLLFSIFDEAETESYLHFVQFQIKSSLSRIFTSISEAPRRYAVTFVAAVAVSGLCPYLYHGEN